MAYQKAPRPSTVYHLTQKGNLDSILDDGVIRRFGDTECWFCETLPKMKSYMEQTVMCEGKPYYAVGGQLCRYPKFVPEDYVLLKLTPCGYEDKWYRWEQEIPPGSPKALIRAAREFSALKIGTAVTSPSVTQRSSMCRSSSQKGSYRAIRCRPHRDCGIWCSHRPWRNY